MPIYRIDSDKIEPIQPTTFAEQDLRERRDLQAPLKTRITLVSLTSKFLGLPQNLWVKPSSIAA